MSFILKGDEGLGTKGFSDVSLDGYREMADYLIDLYNNHKISNYDRTGNTADVLEFFGAKDMEELRLKRY